MSKQKKDIRQYPTGDFISDIRNKYPTESEVDRVLTRKMKSRHNQVQAASSLEEMISSAKELISNEWGEEFEIQNAEWLTGGASKIQMAFDFIPAVARETFKPFLAKRMVVRMEPVESVVETSRLREFQVLNAVRDVVPVPYCYWADVEGTYFPNPALIYEFVDGTVKPRKFVGKQVTGIGINFGSELRQKLAPQFVEHLVRIHTMDLSGVDLSAFELPEIGSKSSVIRQVNWWRRVWEEDRFEDIPLMELVYNWLVDNAPPIEKVSLVHGDYRSGNFLFNESIGEITAWLDWELSVLGDRHQDLAWATYRLFGHSADDSDTPLISGMLRQEDFFRMYEEKSGLPVDPERLRYYRILCCFMSVTHSLATAGRASRGEKTHQDIVLTTFSKIGYYILDELRDYLKEEL